MTVKLKKSEPEINIGIRENQQFKKLRLKENKKYESFLDPEVSVDDIYRPKLWYYDLMSSLDDSETSRKLISNLDVQ